MNNIGSSLPALQSSRLLDQVRERIRCLHYSIRTEQPYVHGVRAFVRFHELKRHPSLLDEKVLELHPLWLMEIGQPKMPPWHVRILLPVCAGP